MKRAAILLLASTLAACASDAPREPYAYDSYPVRAERAAFDPAGVPPGAAAREADRRGREALAQGDLESAGLAFGEALDVNPFDPIALNNLAVARAQQGRYVEAEGLLERAARLAPEETEIAANLGRLREWLRSYAITPEEPTGLIPAEVLAPRADASGLPPEPPALWTQQRP